ncbi:transcriptional regulator, LysR family [Glaciecola sp. 4H-3-7+YE-5]|nr:transcriptional regulator, LysR family [Glaciecola sp. 4H-3-7+YE-5]
MEIRQLRHFIAVVEAGNLRKASENTHITHPALSMSLKSLESSLGVKLLERDRRGIALTYAGEKFLPAAHSLLKQIDDLRSSLLGTQDSPTGNVRLGIPYGINNALAAPLFKQLQERYPGINLIIEEGNTTSLERSFDNDLLDLMISYDIQKKLDQKSEPLYVEQLYLVSAFDPTLAQDAEVNFADLVNFPIVSSPGTHSMRRTLERYAFENGIQFDFSLDFQSAHSSLKIAVEGLAHTIAPWDLIHDHVRGNLISARRIVSPCMERTACLVSSLRGVHTTATDAVISSIKSAIDSAKKDDKIRGRSFIH